MVIDSVNGHSRLARNWLLGRLWRDFNDDLEDEMMEERPHITAERGDQKEQASRRRKSRSRDFASPYTRSRRVAPKGPLSTAFRPSTLCGSWASSSSSSKRALQPFPGVSTVSGTRSSSQLRAQVLREAEEKYPLLGTALLDVFFPGSLRVR